MVSLTDEEKVRADRQIEAMKKAFEIIKSKNVNGVEPLFIPNEETLLRSDEAKKWEGADAALAEAPAMQGKLIKVPLVLG